MAQYTLAITIVNYNTQDLLLYNLKKIQQAEIAIPYQVLVLDNASRDGKQTIERVNEEFPDVITLPETINHGYTKGVNILAQYADAEYILNINTDAFLEKGDVEKMIEYMQSHPEIGLLAPQLLNFDGSIQDSAYHFLTPELALYRRTPLGLLPHAVRKLEEFTMKKQDLSQIQEVDWLLGAVILFPKAVAEKVGHLDEDMFLYLSDTYFAWQIWEQGYKVVYYPEVKMYHYHRQSSRNRNLWKALTNKVYWIHIQDGITFFRKTWQKPNPRLALSNKI